MRNCVDMSTLMLPAATMTTMTNTAPIAVAQPKADPVKGTLLGNNNNNTSSNKQGRIELETVRVVCRAANEPSAKFSQSQRGPLLGPSPG